ncbi:glyoxalase [Halobacteriales archaeon QS_1_68_20]|nr:MAG: glyoxalase [Halobacteriales archaeon QS_1_68_20]
MTGIVFFRTADLAETVEFYTDRVGADVWLEQPGCTILEYDNLLVGFCEREEVDREGIVTLAVDDRETVDELHEQLADRAREQPRENETYDIYQFFAEDPDGRTLEVQTFLHETPDI